LLLHSIQHNLLLLSPSCPPANDHGVPALPPEDHGRGLEQLAALLAADVDEFEEQQQQQQQAQQRQDQQQQQDEDDGTDTMTMTTMTGHCRRRSHRRADKPSMPSSLPLLPTTMTDWRSGQKTMVEVLNTWRRCWLLDEYEFEKQQKQQSTGTHHTTTSNRQQP
jgi:hypothetical protein